jgi:hypothetical protein
VLEHRLQSVRPELAALAVVVVAAIGCATNSELVPQPTATAGDGGCEDRARARLVCLGAVDARCDSLRGDCEARCEPRLGPGNSEKEPALRGDMEADRCREGCRETDRGCRRGLADRCPRPCLAPLACEPADPACDADAGP